MRFGQGREPGPHRLVILSILQYRIFLITRTGTRPSYPPNTMVPPPPNGRPSCEIRTVEKIIFTRLNRTRSAVPQRNLNAGAIANPDLFPAQENSGQV